MNHAEPIYTPMDETCADHSPAAQLIAAISAEVAPCTLSGYLPDGSLRPNGGWIAELDARDDDKARTIARLESRLRYTAVALIAAWLVGAVLGLLTGGGA